MKWVEMELVTFCVSVELIRQAFGGLVPDFIFKFDMLAVPSTQVHLESVHCDPRIAP